LAPGGRWTPCFVHESTSRGQTSGALVAWMLRAGPTYTPDVSPGPGGTRERPLRGRAAELAAIGARLDEVRSGVGSVIIVEGRAGLGKTRLLDACASMAAERSFGVGRGVAEPHRRAVELDALLDALFGGRKPLLARNALSDLHASPEQRFWLLQDVQALIEKEALQRPLLICLDDLHLAGDGCAEAMRQLPRRLASLPVGWVMAFRPDQGLSSVQSAKDELAAAGAEVVRLGPLGREAVMQIAADVLGADPDGGLLRKSDQVRGNPFLLIEFFRGLQDERLVAVEAGRARLVEDRLPRRVSDNMRARLLRMSPAANRLATLASALGRRFSVQELAQMAGMPVAELLDPVKELAQADIFTESGGRLAFGHDLIREAVRASSPVPVRRALDRQAADVLVARGALPVEVAEQLADCAEPGDEAAIATLLEAAATLGSSDPAGSAALAGRALELAPPQHPLRGPLVARRVVSLFTAGLLEEATRFAASALRQALPSEEEARVRLAVAGMFDLSSDVRADNTRAALALPGLSADTRALLWASLLHNVVAAARTEEAGGLLPKARDAVPDSRRGTAWFTLELARSGLQYQRSDVNGALEILAAAQRHSLPGQDDARARMADTFKVSFLAALDRFDEAFHVADNGIAGAQKDRQNWALRMFETLKGRLLLQRGRLAEAAVALEGRFSLDDADRVAGREAANIVALGKLKIHSGDDAGAREVAEIAKLMMRASAPVVQHHGAWYLALHAMSQGEADVARDWLCSCGHANRLQLFPLFPFEIEDDPQLVRIAVAAGDGELAGRTIEHAERRCELNPDIVSFRAATAHARGLWQGSEHDLQTAVSIFATGPRPLATASALEDLGRLQAVAGASADAIRSLDRALTINAQAGASWDAARVRGRLRQLGVRRRIAVPKRPATGWEALTSAEASIARLAAEGKTNREIAETLFISPHTVNSHLRHIFDKLGVNSRIQLTKMAGAQPARHAD
jgi:DNA-binding CsgD family transcriptional regulator